MKRQKSLPENSDPFPYDDPIARADGVRPYNHYLWPTESWWAYNHFGYRGFSGRFHFGIVALANGRWATEGFVWQIEANSDRPFRHEGDRPGRPVVFDTREKAVRIAAARFIRLCRWSRKWDWPDHLTEENCRKAVNWALAIANRPEIEFKPIPPPAPKPTGLPILDYLASH